jgi:TRAP-type transport system periplasmic protein
VRKHGTGQAQFCASRAPGFILLILIRHNQFDFDFSDFDFSDFDFSFILLTTAKGGFKVLINTPDKEERMHKALRIAFLLVVLLGVTAVAVAAPAAEQETFTWKIGHANAPLENSALHVTATKFQELVEKYSDGRIKIEVYPSAQLGNDREMADLTVSGSIDGFVTSLNLITQYAPRMDALILPYMFEKSENFRKAAYAMWDENNAYLVNKANMRMFTMWDSGFRHIMSAKPVRNLSDLRKMKFRVPPSPVMVAMIESWGHSPTPVEWSELFNAMQLGVVDAFEVDDSVLISARMNEVVKYITNNDHQLQVSLGVLSEDSYQKLPADLKAVVDKASMETMAFAMENAQKILDEAIKVSIRDHGLQVLGPPEDYDEWARRARTIWPAFYERIGEGDAKAGKAFVDKLFAAAGM